MLMPKKTRINIYEYLFTEGVLVAKKDLQVARHPHIDASNLHVVKAMQSLVSRGYVKEQFAWRHYYWYLTNEGIQYLRDYLHLPAEIVPSTLTRKPQRDTRVRQDPAEVGMSAGTPADRDVYRRPGGDDKEAGVGAGADASFKFRGGFGRGRPTGQ